MPLEKLSCEECGYVKYVDAEATVEQAGRCVRCGGVFITAVADSVRPKQKFKTYFVAFKKTETKMVEQFESFLKVRFEDIRQRNSCFVVASCSKELADWLKLTRNTLRAETQRELEHQMLRG